jgi:tRNA threonylcarbamoyl adenosine modification protein YjeE
MTEYSFTCPDAASTAALGARLGKLLKTGDVVLLYGDLGAGKTTFARGLIQGLTKTHEIVSPTFTLVQTYPGTSGMIYHYDLYRMKNKDAASLEELGWEDGLLHGISLVEWPERLKIIPMNALIVRILMNNNSRQVILQGEAQTLSRFASL